MKAIYGGDILRLRNLATELNWYCTRPAEFNAYIEIAGFLALHASEEADSEIARVQGEVDRLIS